MKTLITWIIRLLVIIIGFSCFLSIPTFLWSQVLAVTPNGTSWYQQVSMIFLDLIHIQSLESLSEWFTLNTFDRYMYTMQLFFISIILVAFCSLILAFLFYLATPKVKNYIRRWLSLSESTPDLFVILLFITVVIFLYKTYDLKFLQLYGFNAEPLVIPIIVISYLPIAFFTEYLIQLVEQEKDKDYVILAKAKGLSRRIVFFKHMVKNIVPLCLPYARKIMFILLSNIVLVENILKIQGFTTDLFKIFMTPPFIVAINFLLFALPIIVLELVSRTYSLRGKGVSTL